VFAPDGLVGRVQGTSQIQYTFDQRGSVSQRLDGLGNILNSSIHDSFGNESSTSTISDTFGFGAKCGYYFDRENNLYLCQHRYYDPIEGAWLNRDPLGVEGGINVYSYCGGNPTMGIDPLGYCDWACIGAALAAGGTALIAILDKASAACRAAIAACVAAEAASGGAASPLCGWAVWLACGAAVLGTLMSVIGAMIAAYELCEKGGGGAPGNPGGGGGGHKPAKPKKAQPVKSKPPRTRKKAGKGSLLQ
jgi:RHS repeat-associated protein